MTYEVIIDGKPHRVELNHVDGRMLCRLDGKDVNADAVVAARDVMSLVIDGLAFEIKRERVRDELHVVIGADRYAAEVRDPRSLRTRKAGAAGLAGPKKLISPMPGKIVRLLLGEGAEVHTGQGIIIVEAMKMQNEIKSPKDGVVKKILTMEGATVNAGEALAIVE